LPSGIVYTGSTPSVWAGKDLYYNGNCGTNCQYFKHSQYGSGGGHGFYGSGTVTAANSYLGTTTPAYNGYTPMDYITTANQMVALRDSLLAGTTPGKKPAPYYLSDSTRIKYQKTWTQWRDLYCGSDCQSQKGSYLTPADWNLIYEKVNLSAPALLQNGYMYIVMDSASTQQLANISTAQASVLLTHNFIFYFKGNSTSVKNAFGNTSDSRVVWWSRTGFSEFGTAQPVYGIIYAQAGSITTVQNTLRVHGQVLIADPTKNISTNTAIEVWYDSTVLADISASTGLMRQIGTSDSPTQQPSAISAPYVFTLLSSRLDVGLESEVWGPTKVDLSSSNVRQFGRSLALTPQIIPVTEDIFTNWNDFIALNPVNGVVLPDSLASGCSAPQPVSTSSVVFSTPGTYVVSYRADCSSGNSPTANLIVWVKPPSVSVVSSSSMSGSSSSAGAGSSSSMGSGGSDTTGTSSSSDASGMAYKFMYNLNNPSSCFPTIVDTIPIGLAIYNGSGQVVDLTHFRATYFIKSSTKSASNWTYVTPEDVYPSADIEVQFFNVLSPVVNVLGNRFNVIARITWNPVVGSTVLMGSGVQGYFRGLKLAGKNHYYSSATNDYSYPGSCPNEWSENPYVVFERRGANDTTWTPVAGEMPEFSYVP